MEIGDVGIVFQEYVVINLIGFKYVYCRYNLVIVELPIMIYYINNQHLFSYITLVTICVAYN